MSHDSVRAEDLFLEWLLDLPENCDPSVAAASRLVELAQDADKSIAEAGFRELLRRVTPFAPRRTARHRRHRVTPRS